MSQGWRIAVWTMSLLLAVAALPLRAEDVPTLREHLEHARYAQALELARTLVAEEPAQAAPLALLGEALYATGELEAAEEAWTRAQSLDGPGVPEARVALARRLLARGNVSSARASLREVVADSAGARERPVLLASAEAARLLGRFDPAVFRTAVDLYQRAIDTDPQAAMPRVALAGLLLEKYNNTEASALLRETLSDAPEHPRVLLALSESLRFDHSDDYQAMLVRALALAPLLLEAHTLMAQASIETGNLEVAEGAIDSALAINPRALQTLAAQAALAFVRDDAEALDTTLQRAVAVAPGDASVLVTLAEVAEQRRRYAEAAEFARRGTRVDRFDWRAHGLLGSNRIRFGDMRLGRESLERAFRGDPFNAWFKNTLDLLDELERYEQRLGGQFRLIAAPEEMPALAPLLLPLADEAYQRLAERYQHRLPAPLRVEFYPERSHLSVRTLGLVGVDLLGVSFGPVLVMDSPRTRPDSFNWGSVLWHELAHSFHLHMSAHRAPRWFSEGLAVHEEHLARPGWGSDVDAGFLAAWRAGELRAASELDEAFLRPRSPAALSHAYVQAGELLAMFEHRAGIEGIRAMLLGYREGRDTPTLVKKVLGLDAAALDDAFDAWLRERYAGALEAMATETPDGEESPGGAYVHDLRIGWGALEAGELGTAERAFMEAWRAFPTHAGSHGPLRGLVQVHEARGDLAETARWLRRLVAVDGDDLAAHLELAGAEEQLGHDGAAVRALHAALFLEPFDPDIRARLANHLERHGRWQEAARERAAIASLAPPDPVAARYLHARALLRAGDAPGAREPLLRALEAAPLYEPALELLLELRATFDAAEGPDS